MPNDVRSIINGLTCNFRRVLYTEIFIRQPIVDEKINATTTEKNNGIKQHENRKYVKKDPKTNTIACAKWKNSTV